MTVIEKENVKKLEYFGNGRKGKELWIYTFGIPYKKSVLPIYVKRYKPEELTRNENHKNMIEELIEIAGEEIIIVFDAEFTYEELIKELEEKEIGYVLPIKNKRVKLVEEGTGKIYRLEDIEMEARAKGRIEKIVSYKGGIRVKVVGMRLGLGEGRGRRIKVLMMPEWMDSEEGIKAYKERVKIEETFKDWKSYQGIEKLMFKKESILDKVMMLTVLAYVIFTKLGEYIKENVNYNYKLKKRRSGYFLLKYEVNRFVNKLKDIIYRGFYWNILRLSLPFVTSFVTR